MSLKIVPPQATAIASLRAYRVPLPLRAALHHASVATQILDEIFLELQTVSGALGMAEVRGNGKYATGYDVEDILRDLQAVADSLHRYPAERASALVYALTGNRMATALIEAAALDALARASDVPLWRYLGYTGPLELPTHASIGFVDAKLAARLAAEAVGLGFQRIKVRVGSRSLGSDIERVAAVRSAVGQSCAIAVDANGAWTAETACHAAQQLQPFTLAWLEQPTPRGDHDAMRAVRETAGIRVVADESVRTTQDVLAIAERGSADGVHVKIEKCGTVDELRRAVRMARAHGLFVEIGQMDEGRLGSSFIACVAASAGADAFELWGFERIAHDVARGVEVRDGALALVDRPGTGVSVDIRGAKEVVKLC